MLLLMRRIAVGVLFAAACGGSGPAAPRSGDAAEGPVPTEAEIEQAKKPCGKADEVRVHDLHATASTEAFTPCAGSGARDYSALVKIETIEDGVHIVIDAADDDVTILGPDVKERDAVIVYPRGKGERGVEVPLTKTKTGYRGDKVVFWNDLDRLTDDGTKIDVAIYDHDKKSGTHEQLHVAVAVSTGKSCERAQDENPQTVQMGKADSRPDLTREQLGAPIGASNAAVTCALPDSSHAKICALVRNGKPLGVTVNVDPIDNRVAACIDKRIRGLRFPLSDKPDTVTYSY